jgi:hypothetical protein
MRTYKTRNSNMQDLDTDKEDSIRRDLKSTRWDGMYRINVVQKIWK